MSDIGMGETITLVKMAKLLGISKATAARVTKSLRDKKIIDRQGSAKKGQWIILK